MADEILPEPYVVSADLVRDVSDALREGRTADALALIGELHAADIADLTEALPSELRDALVHALGRELDPEMLAELVMIASRRADSHTQSRSEGIQRTRLLTIRFAVATFAMRCWKTTSIVTSSSDSCQTS